jgi:hypothetical protein
LSVFPNLRPGDLDGMNQRTLLLMIRQAKAALASAGEDAASGKQPQFKSVKEYNDYLRKKGYLRG